MGRHRLERLDLAAAAGRSDVIPMAADRAPRGVPWMTLLLVSACVAVFFLVQPVDRPLLQLGENVADPPSAEELRFAVRHAAIPCELVQGRPLTEDEFARTFVGGDDRACDPGGGGPAHEPAKVVLVAVLVSLFLHGDFVHLFGNMLFLWVFGRGIEDRKGPWRYLLVYAAAGIVATVAHVLVNPDSTIPIIGASGAIAGVMGAYLAWLPRERIKTIVFFGPVLLRRVQASWVLGVWLVLQVLLIGSDSEIAWAAHLGGFAFGLVVGLVWRARDRRPASSATTVVPDSGRR